MELKVHSRRPVFKIVGLVCGLLLVVAATIIFVFTRHLSAPESRTVTQETVAPVAKAVGITNTSLHVGDVFWGRYMNDWSMKSPLKYAYPFSGLSTFGRENYDAWVADLECPSVPGLNMTSSEMEATLTFNCDPAYLSEAAKWFTVFSNANNHSDNQAAQTGLDATWAELDKNNIQHFGHFDPESLDNLCEVISMPVKIQMSDKTVKTGKLPVAYCGHHGVFKNPTAASLAVIGEYSKYMPTIAYPHSGQEYKTGPDQIKTDFYRGLIDNGADVVLGDHPHWVQTTEAYKGRLIVYSMGNFMFDQQDTREVTRSAAIAMDLKLAPEADVSQLEQWLKLGETCKTYHDDCLLQAQKSGLKKLNFSYDFSVVGSDDSNKLTKKADPALQASILQRLNWQQTISKLQSPYSGH